MTDRPTGSKPSQTALSEALEQAADAVKLWCDDITSFVKGEADKVASNHFGLTDLVTAPIGLMRVCLKNSIATAFAFQDNLALLSYSRPRTPPPPKVVRVLADIPAKARVDFVASDMIGDQTGYRIPSSKIKVISDKPAVDDGKARPVEVVIKVTAPHAAVDVYKGSLSSTGPPVVTVPVVFVLYEFGTP